MNQKPLEGACANTDRELWREIAGDYYADSIHVTASGSIGMNCGGHIIVMPIREWFTAAQGFLVAQRLQNNLQDLEERMRHD